MEGRADTYSVPCSPIRTSGFLKAHVLLEALGSAGLLHRSPGSWIVLALLEVFGLYGFLARLLVLLRAQALSEVLSLCKAPGFRLALALPNRLSFMLRCVQH